MNVNFYRLFGAILSLLLSVGCAVNQAQLSQTNNPDPRAADAIKAMAGVYDVTFDFTETVAFQAGYELKKPYVTGAKEIVRVIEDRPGFISLQHILLVGGEQPVAIKHWRQDWTYQPNYIMEFVGFNGWKKRLLTDHEKAGKWSQTVYQVDDSLRYAGLAAWTFDSGVPTWASAPSMRPLPRRDMTKRSDYDAIMAVNRHAITHNGWVHEQDNSKLILRNGTNQALAREVGINSYIKSDTIDPTVADDYWMKTKDYWAAVRELWLDQERKQPQFALTVQGEPTVVYQPLMNLAQQVAKQEVSLEQAIATATTVIDKFTTSQLFANNNTAVTR